MVMYIIVWFYSIVERWKTCQLMPSIRFACIRNFVRQYKKKPGLHSHTHTHTLAKINIRRDLQGKKCARSLWILLITCVPYVAHIAYLHDHNNTPIPYRMKSNRKTILNKSNEKKKQKQKKYAKQQQQDDC